MKKQSPLFNKYNVLVHPARVNFLKSSGINFFMTESSNRELHAFLLAWTGFSIRMTENVENWIIRAGESCETQNYTEVGNRLKYHASQEADHDLMLVDDLALLLSKWNKIYNDNLTSEDIFNMNMPKQADSYIALHEDTINGQHPYTQVAIEYEIERISVMYGPKIIENIVYTLGNDFENGISFLTDHVLIDQGHTKFNIDLMEKCFNAGSSVYELANTGAAALKIYSGFLTECISLGSIISKRDQWKSDLTI